MIEYTPTTEEVRINYIGTTPELAADKPWQEQRPGEFNRWLAEHDRQTAELAWDNAIEFFEDCFYGEVTSASEHNPFRTDTNA